MTVYRNLQGRIAYEVDPHQGGGVYTWPIYLDFDRQDDPLLIALLARIREQLAARTAREGKDGPGDIMLG